jgi:hypothetical protein
MWATSTGFYLTSKADAAADVDRARARAALGPIDDWLFREPRDVVPRARRSVHGDDAAARHGYNSNAGERLRTG